MAFAKQTKSPGCDDDLACNFDPVSTDNDGTCFFCCYSVYDTTSGFSIEVERYAGIGAENPGLPNLTTFRLYVTCSDPEDRVTRRHRVQWQLHFCGR